MRDPVWRTHERAGSVLGAVVVVGLQALALCVVAGVGVVALFSHGTSASQVLPGPDTGTGDTSWGLFLASLAGAAVLVLLAWSMAIGRTWARGPLVTIELLAVFVGISTAVGGEVGEGVAIAVSAAAVVALLFLRGAPAATTSERRRRGAYPDD